MTRLLAALAATLLLASCTTPPSASTATPAAAIPAKGDDPVARFVGDVRRTVLPNGLTVLTKSGSGSGVVAIDTWVKAGYFNEPDEVAGMAHLFEHMFF